MKKIISERRGLFETNSSSSHSLSLNIDAFNFKTKYFTDYEKEHYIKNNKYYLNFKSVLELDDDIGFLCNDFNDKVIILLIKFLKNNIYISKSLYDKENLFFKLNAEKTFSEHLSLENKISNQGLSNIYHNLYLDQKLISDDILIIRYFKMIKRILKNETGLELVIPKNLTAKISEIMSDSSYEIYQSLDDVINFIYKNYNDIEEGIKDFILDCGIAIKIYCNDNSIEYSSNKSKYYSNDINIDNSLLFCLLDFKSNNYSLDSLYDDIETYNSDELNCFINYLENPEYKKIVDKKMKNFIEALEKYANNSYTDISVFMSYLEFKNSLKEEELKNEKNSKI